MADEYYYFKEEKDGVEELFRMSVEQDDEPLNCRTDWDGNVGNMMCWYRNYNLGDEHKFKEPYDMFANLLQKENVPLFKISDMLESEGGIQKAIDYLEKECDYLFIPLNVYEHSGITMYTGSKDSHFDSQWDCSQVGWIYTTKGKVFETQAANLTEESFTNETWREIATEWLESEVKQYDQYLTGQVYWFKLEKFEPDDIDEVYEIDGEEGWEEQDSCGGFYSDKYGEELAREIANDSVTSQPFISEEEAQKILSEQVAEYEKDIFEKLQEKSVLEQGTKNTQNVFATMGKMLFTDYVRNYLTENGYCENQDFTQADLMQLADDFVANIATNIKEQADNMMDMIKDYLRDSGEVEKRFGVSAEIGLQDYPEETLEDK